MNNPDHPWNPSRQNTTGSILCFDFLINKIDQMSKNLEDFISTLVIMQHTLNVFLLNLQDGQNKCLNNDLILYLCMISNFALFI